MGADCSSEQAPNVRSVRPSPVVSSVSDDRPHRRGARRGGAQATASAQVEDGFDYDFEFEYDLDSPNSVEGGGNEKNAKRNKAAGPDRRTDHGHPVSPSGESGVSGNNSFIGYVPTQIIDAWFDSLPTDTSALEAVPDVEVCSDGEKEYLQWMRTEASLYFDDGARSYHVEPNASSEGLGYRPNYVLAVGLQSQGEKEEVEQLKRMQLKRQKQQQQQQQQRRKTLISRCT